MAVCKVKANYRSGDEEANKSGTAAEVAVAAGVIVVGRWCELTWPASGPGLTLCTAQMQIGSDER